VITFVGQGLSNQLFLDSAGNKTLTSAVFKTILDDYQKETGNQILVILEASYSGTFVPTLAATDRVIVSSTDNNLIYYKNLGRASFLKLYFDQLRNGEDFLQAWQTVTGKLSGHKPPFNQQSPQLEDANAGSLAEKLCLNGCFGGLPGVLTLRVEKLPPIVPRNQPINLNVSTHFASGQVYSVTATMLKPAMTFNGFGHPNQPPLFIGFNHINNRRRNSQEQWQSQVTGEQLTTPGTYTFLFNAIDDKDFSADESATFCVESCDAALGSSRLTNISTRAAILGGANDVIAGFIITGTGTQKVIIRALSLEAGVDPKLTVHQYPSGDLLASNDNWQTDPRVAEIPAHLVLPNPIDAGVLLDLPVGAYTAILSSGGAKGLGLISVDEVESNSTTKLTNISTRASIQGGANDVIAGFIITGTGSQKVMIRGLALEAGVNPKLTLQKYPSGELVATNDNWQTDSRASEIPEHMKLQSPTDAGLLLDLPVGAYTAILSSVGAKGLGLIGVDAIE